MNNNSWIINRDSKAFLLTCLAILMLQTVTDAQKKKKIERRSGDIEMYTMMQYFGGNGLDDYFTSRRFLTDTTSKVNFKKISMAMYEANDSTLSNKRSSGKKIWVFNHAGFATMLVGYDSLGKCSDSVVIDYDKNDKISRKVNYKRPDSGVLQKNEAEFITRDANENEAKDSTWKRSSYRVKDGGPSAEVIYRKFDERGNCVSHLTITDGDTTANIKYQYDDKNRVIKYSNTNVNTTRFTKYDDSSNIIEQTSYTLYDTSRWVETYDDKNRRLTADLYEHDKIKRKSVYRYNPDGGRTEKTENYTDPVGVSSCSIQETTVSIYDKYDNEVSEITTKVQGSETSTKSDIHIYHYTPLGKVISDTEIIAEEGQWHSSKTMKVSNNKYDAHENLLEEVSRGNEYQASNKKITYTYNDKDQVLQQATYSSCDDGTPYNIVVKKYYTDGKTIQTEDLEMKASNTHMEMSFGKDSRMLGIKASYRTQSMQIIMEYVQ